MMNRPIFSILTPTVPERDKVLARLTKQLAGQIEKFPVEHLVFRDNRRRTIGEKRDALLRAAKGDYVAFVDDDDFVAPDYVESLVAAMASRPDVVTFLQGASVNGGDGLIDFGLGNPNEAFVVGGTAKRNAWHVCPWRRELAVLSHFPSCNYGEDWAYAERLCRIPGLTSVHIPRVLHFYTHTAEATLAPIPGNKHRGTEAQRGEKAEPWLREG